MHIKTLPPGAPLPPNIILPSQTHGNRIVEVITENENLNACDGLWTKDKKFILGIKTADCAPICFWNEDRFGILHAGWRGLVNGAVENMCKTFFAENTHKSSNSRVRTKVWVGPILPRFEIQKDDCYDQLCTKFGKQFFEDNVENSGKLIFNFEAAIKHLLPMAQFDGRSTYDTLELASWRRDQDDRRNATFICSEA